LGQTVGRISINLDGEEVTSRNLVALNSVAPAGFFGRAWDGMKLWVGGWFGDE
jgi:D-alanyl-D-alanine carboxypeptidase (penicillin-binding protein 5/6)